MDLPEVPFHSSASLASRSILWSQGLQNLRLALEVEHCGVLRCDLVQSVAFRRYRLVSST